MVGIGANNAKGRIDNVAVQMLPEITTLEKNEKFDSSTGLLAAANGQWMLNGGTYIGAPTAGSDTVQSLVQMDIEPAYLLQLETTLKTQLMSGVIFDQYSPTDFKFAAISVSTG